MAADKPLPADRLPENHPLRPWLKKIGYTESWQGSVACVYHDDVVALCKLVDDHVQAEMVYLRDKSLAFAIEIELLKDRVADQIALNHALQIENERMQRAVLKASQYALNSPMIVRDGQIKDNF